MQNSHELWTRRSAGLSLLALSGSWLSACISQDPVQRYQRAMEAKFTPEEKAVRARFHDIDGYELFLDAITGTDAVELLSERNLSVTAAAKLSPSRNLRMGSSSPYGIPRFFRVTWREGDWQRNNELRDMQKIAMQPNGTFSGGKVVGDYIVPVAERIPDELLAEKRQRKLGLRIKLRIHPDGVLLGWDLQGPPGTGPNYGKYTLAGGDFQEADIYNGKALRMGWYIHPKTKERIETPF